MIILKNNCRGNEEIKSEKAKIIAINSIKSGSDLIPF